MIYIPDSLKDGSKVCVDDKILECYGSAEEVLKIVKARDKINKNITIIAAGGIKLSNIEEYAATMADFIVSSSFFHASPMDIKVVMEKEC